jgi:NTP pyrophosphatase (non-canonical NTP hydrolase)
MILWNALGIGGEAGEVVDYIKKGILHEHGISKDVLKEELGDLLWYIAGLCTQFGISLEDVMTYNIEKLRNRYPEGFSIEDSKNRR